MEDKKEVNEMLTSENEYQGYFDWQEDSEEFCVRRLSYYMQIKLLLLEAVEWAPQWNRKRFKCLLTLVEEGKREEVEKLLQNFRKN